MGTSWNFCGDCARSTVFACDHTPRRGAVPVSLANELDRRLVLASFVSCPDPAYLTPSTMNVRTAPGRSREDVRNAILFRQRAAERSAATVAAIAEMHRSADQFVTVLRQMHYRAGLEPPRITELAPILGGGYSKP